MEPALDEEEELKPRFEQDPEFALIDREEKLANRWPAQETEYERLTRNK